MRKTVKINLLESLHIMEFTESRKNLLKEVNKKMRICDDLTIEKNRNLIFVYCPPKVGSTTLVSSIRLSATNKFTVLHIHNELMLKILCNIENVTINEIIKYNNSLGKKVYVIDIYRSPIEQKISLFFEDICSYHFNNTAENINKYDVNRIIARFNCIFPYLSNNDYYRNEYNIPILDSFHFSNKYIIQIQDNIKYIKLRLKDANDWPNILKSILGVEIRLVNDYETENKEIKDMYIKFKSVYKIPSHLFGLIEENAELKYYYSEVERLEYLNQWRNKISNNECKIYTPEEYNLYNTICLENQVIHHIQDVHYKDVGCNCMGCSMKRKNIMERLKRGEILNSSERITHDEAKNEYLKCRGLIALSTNIFNINTKIKSKNILRNRFSSSVKGIK